MLDAALNLELFRVAERRAPEYQTVDDVITGAEALVMWSGGVGFLPSSLKIADRIADPAKLYG